MIFSGIDLTATGNKPFLMAALDIFLLFDYHRDKNLKTWACHLLPISTTLYSEESIQHNSTVFVTVISIIIVNCSSDLALKTFTSVDIFSESTTGNNMINYDANK